MSRIVVNAGLTIDAAHKFVSGQFATRHGDVVVQLFSCLVAQAVLLSL